MANLANKYFSDQSGAVSTIQQAQWETDIHAAESVRLKQPAAMDIYGAKRHDIQSMESDVGVTPSTSPAEVWLQAALAVEQYQYVEPTDNILNTDSV